MTGQVSQACLSRDAEDAAENAGMKNNLALTQVLFQRLQKKITAMVISLWSAFAAHFTRYMLLNIMKQNKTI